MSHCSSIRQSVSIIENHKQCAMATSNHDLQINIDALIERLITEGRKVPQSKNVARHISFKEMNYLCDKSKEIFLEEPTLLELQAPINICGKTETFEVDD